MEEAKTRESWTENQLKYIEFLGRGKVDKLGDSYTKEEFAKAIGVNPDTLYRWQKLPGFRVAVFEASLGDIVDRIPAMNKIMAGKAMGLKSAKSGDTQAYLALMRQFELLKSDKTQTDINISTIDAVTSLE